MTSSWKLLDLTNTAIRRFLTVSELHIMPPKFTWPLYL